MQTFFLIFLLNFFSASGLLPNCTQDAWVKKAALPASSRNYGLGFCIGDKGYFGMGHKQTKPFVYKTYNDLWAYDPKNDAWTQLADFPGTGRLMPKGFMVNGKIYAGFGYIIAASGPNAGGNEYQTDMYEYNLGANSWSKKNESLLGRGDIFFIAGGQMYSVNPEYRSLNKYNGLSDTWFESNWEKDLIVPHASDITGDNACFSLANKEYLITTVWKKNKILNELWGFDPKQVNWKRMNDLPSPGSDTIRIFSCAEKIFAQRNGRDVVQYDPGSDVWSVKAEVSAEHRDFIPAFSLGEKVYGFSKFEFWEFTP